MRWGFALLEGGLRRTEGASQSLRNDNQHPALDGTGVSKTPPAGCLKTSIRPSAMAQRDMDRAAHRRMHLQKPRNAGSRPETTFFKTRLDGDVDPAAVPLDFAKLVQAENDVANLLVDKTGFGLNVSELEPLPGTLDGVQHRISGRDTAATPGASAATGCGGRRR